MDLKSPGDLDQDHVRHQPSDNVLDTPLNQDFQFPWITGTQAIDALQCEERKQSPRRFPGQRIRPSSLSLIPPSVPTPSTDPFEFGHSSRTSPSPSRRGMPSPSRPHGEGLTPPLPCRSMGHKRSGSEFVGGATTAKGGPVFVTNSVVPPGVNNNVLLIKEDQIQAANVQNFGSFARKRGHAHRRSGAVSHSDLKFAMSSEKPFSGGNSAPSTPADSSYPTTLHDFPFEHPSNSYSQKVVTAVKKAQIAGESSPSPPQRDSSRTRVGFSDQLEYIPRPLSTISSETSSSMSTIRALHSGADSVTSVPSAGPSSPVSSRDANRASQDRLREDVSAKQEPLGLGLGFGVSLGMLGRGRASTKNLSFSHTDAINSMTTTAQHRTEDRGDLLSRHIHPAERGRQPRSDPVVSSERPLSSWPSDNAGTPVASRERRLIQNSARQLERQDKSVTSQTSANMVPHPSVSISDTSPSKSEQIRTSPSPYESRPHIEAHQSSLNKSTAPSPFMLDPKSSTLAASRPRSTPDISSLKRQHKMRSWAESLLHRKEKSSHEDLRGRARTTTPWTKESRPRGQDLLPSQTQTEERIRSPEQSRSNDDQIEMSERDFCPTDRQESGPGQVDFSLLDNIDFDNDTSCIIEAPPDPSQKDEYASGLFSSTHGTTPPTSPVDFESPTPMIDLDAALGSWTDLRSSASDTGIRTKRRLHSSGETGGFTGPGMHYHRRAESAPEMEPFERPQYILSCSGSNSAMDEAIAEEEEEDEVSNSDDILSRDAKHVAGVPKSGESKRKDFAHLKTEHSLQERPAPTSTDQAEDTGSVQRNFSGLGIEVPSSHSKVLARRSRSIPAPDRIARVPTPPPCREIIDKISIIDSNSPTGVYSPIRAAVEVEPRFSVYTKSSDDSTVTPTVSHEPLAFTVSADQDEDSSMSSQQAPLTAPSITYAEPPDTPSVVSSADYTKTSFETHEMSYMHTATSSITDRTTLNSSKMGGGSGGGSNEDDIRSLASSMPSSSAFGSNTHPYQLNSNYACICGNVSNAVPYASAAHAAAVSSSVLSSTSTPALVPFSCPRHGPIHCNMTTDSFGRCSSLTPSSLSHEYHYQHSHQSLSPPRHISSRHQRHRTSSTTGNKRASLASLTGLIGARYNKSKLNIAETLSPDGPEQTVGTGDGNDMDDLGAHLSPEKQKKKKRLSRMMTFWKVKDRKDSVAN